MTDTSEMTEKSTLRKLLPVIAIATGAILGFIFLREYINFETLSENRDALETFRDDNYLVAALAFVAIYTAIAGFSLPGAAITTITGGFLFGTFPGVLFNMLGATFGATAIFMAVRFGFGDRLAAKMETGSGLVKTIKEGIDENQWSMLFLIRLIPVVPFFVANLVPALVDVPVRRFIISTFIGIIPGSLVYTSVGAGLGAVFERGETPDLSIIWEPQILLPILGLCALALLPVIIKAVRGKEGL